MSKVIIMRGVSGAGKSTWVKKNYPHAHVVSADLFFQGEDGKYNFDASKLGEAHAWCLRHFVELVCAGMRVDIVVDNTNTSAVELAPYAAVAAAFGLDVEIHNMHVDIYDAVARNVHHVDTKTIERQMSRFKQESSRIPKWWKQIDHRPEPV
jgi:predicted kinase